MVVEMEVRSPNDVWRFRATGENLTGGGVTVLTNMAMDVDQDVVLSIIPFYGKLGIEVGARIVRQRPGVGFDCIFTRISRSAQFLLRYLLGRSGGLLPVAGTIGG